MQDALEGIVIRLRRRNDNRSFDLISVIDMFGNDVGPNALDTGRTAKRHRSQTAGSGEDKPDREIYGDSTVESFGLFNASYPTKPVSDETGTFPYTGPLLVSLDQPKQSYPVVKPQYCEWFDMESVHEKEKKAFPEYFEKPKSNGEVMYRQYRDFIIKAYRANPRIYLSATACRRSLAADASAIIRIHNFLESWGLINYLVDPGTLPAMSGIAHDPTVVFDVYKHSAHSGVSLSSESVKAPVDDVFAFGSNADAKLAQRRSTVSGASWMGYPKPMDADKVSMVSCSACSKSISGPYLTLRHSLDTVLSLCEDCFGSGKYPEDVSSSDFVKKTVTPEIADFDGWTLNENQLLLDSLSKHGENWKAVAAEVKTKTVEECIQHFVRMPIEDAYIEQMHNTFGSDGMSRTEEPLNPFKDSANPVLAQAAFLASMVSPAVGAAAAQEALRQMNEKSAAVKPQPHAMESSKVKTPLGVGELLSDDEFSSKHVKVQFPWSTAFIARSSIQEFPNEDPDQPLDLETVDQVTKSSLVKAALKAHELSQTEYREIVSNVFDMVRCQMKKVELKLKHFENIDLLLSRERDHLEKCRQKLFAERTQLADARIALQEQADEIRAQQSEMQVDEPVKEEPHGHVQQTHPLEAQ